MLRRSWTRPLALVAIVGAVVVLRSAIVDADLENQQRGGEGGVFVSKPDGLGLVVPRGWHATDQASYPGILLWMTHGLPDAQIVLTAEPFTHRLYCSWDKACRARNDTLAAQLACALGAKLKHQQMRVGAIQPGPKENEANGLPTVWIEYDDGKHFLRHAVALTEDRVVSLLLSTGSAEARASYARSFEQTLRTLRPLTAEETQSSPSEAPIPPNDGGATPTTLPDAAPAAAATTFPSAPAAKQSPIGPCP